MWSLSYVQVLENEKSNSIESLKSPQKEILPLPIPEENNDSKAKSCSGSGDDSDSETLPGLDEEKKDQSIDDSKQDSINADETENKNSTAEIEEDFVIVEPNLLTENKNDNLTLKPSKYNS